MNIVRKLLLTSVIAALPGIALAQTGAAPRAAAQGNCPMVDTSAMRKDMGAMMADMTGMMNRMGDPSQKAQMKMMHEHMAAMMANMKMMNGGMMGGNMMEGGKVQDNKAPQATPTPTKPEDHSAHHPAN